MHACIQVTEQAIGSVDAQLALRLLLWFTDLILILVLQVYKGPETVVFTDGLSS